MLKMMAYEAWVAKGEFETPPPAIRDLPPLYTAALQRWPEAFEFMRHHMFAYVSAALDFSPWGETLVSLWRRAITASPDVAERLCGELQAAHDGFLRQYREAIDSIRPVGDLTERVARLRSALHGYAAIYETDLPLWFIGVLGKALRTRRVDLSAFGGPATSTPQAALIDQVHQQIIGTPLEGPFKAAYAPDLRNAIAHNRYELRARSDVVTLRITDDEREWTEDELWDVIEASQHLLQSVLLAAQVMLTTASPVTAGFVDCGITSMTYTVGDDDFPVVVLSQLWCFRDLDPGGAWIDKARLRIRTIGPHEDEVSLGGRARTSGRPITDGPFGEAVRRAKWVWVDRVPVAPAIDLGLPVITTMEGDVVEVVGPRDRHLVPANFT